MVQAENVEETSKHCVLGRYTVCSTERIEVLSDAIERNHPLRHPPRSLYPEGYHDGNWRNHLRERIYASPRPPPKIFLRQLDAGIGFRSCWRW